MIVASNLFRCSKVCTRISLVFTAATFIIKPALILLFFPLPRCCRHCISEQHPEKAALKTAVTSYKVHSATEKVMLRFSAKLARIPARKRATTSPPDVVSSPGFSRGRSDPAKQPHARAEHTQRKRGDSPFGRSAAEITKTEREMARDPLPVIAMLDTCLRLAALNHLETAMGWKHRHMRGGGRAQAGSCLLDRGCVIFQHTGL